MYLSTYSRTHNFQSYTGACTRAASLLTRDGELLRARLLTRGAHGERRARRRLRNERGEGQVVHNRPAWKCEILRVHARLLRAANFLKRPAVLCSRLAGNAPVGALPIRSVRVDALKDGLALRGRLRDPSRHEHTTPVLGVAQVAARVRLERKVNIHMARLRKDERARVARVHAGTRTKIVHLWRIVVGAPLVGQRRVEPRAARRGLRLHV